MSIARTFARWYLFSSVGMQMAVTGVPTGFLIGACAFIAVGGGLNGWVAGIFFGLPFSIFGGFVGWAGLGSWCEGYLTRDDWERYISEGRA